MSPAPAVRLARRADAREVARLLASFRDWYERDEPTEAEFLTGVLRVMESETGEFLLAGSPAVAFAQVRFRPSVWTQSEDCWLEDLFVSEAARRSGAGAALVEAVLDQAAKRGCRRVELDVDEGNAAAQALYTRFGFRSSKRPGERVFFMQRYL